MMSRKAGLALAAALAAGVLVFDGGVQSSLVKATVLGFVVVVLIASGVPAMLHGERRTMTAPLLLWFAACGWMVLTLAWNDNAVAVAVFPLVCSAALAVSLVGLPLAMLQILAARVALLVGTACSLVAMWMRWHGDVPHGWQGNPDWLGLLLVAAAPFVVARARTAERRERSWAIGVAVLMLVGLALSQSRSAWIGGAVAAIVVTRGRMRMALATLAIVAGTGVIALSDFGRALDGRVWLWSNAWRAGLEQPWLGAGAGRFAFPFLDAQGAALSALPLERAAVRFLNATSAHNDLLHLFVEGGVLAPLLTLGAFTMAAWQLRSRWPAGMAAVVAILVSGLGDVALRQPGVLVFASFALAGCTRISSPRREASLGVVALLVMALSLPGAVAQWIAEHRVESAKTLPAPERIDMLTAAVNTASNPGHPALQLGLLYLSVDQPEMAERYLLKSQETFANVGTDVLLATARIRLNDSRGAIAALQRALARNPARFAAHTNLAEVARRAGDLELAQRHLAAGRELQPHHPKLRDIEESIRRSVIEQASGTDFPKRSSPPPAAPSRSSPGPSPHELGD